MSPTTGMKLKMMTVLRTYWKYYMVSISHYIENYENGIQYLEIMGIGSSSVMNQFPYLQRGSLNQSLNPDGDVRLPREEMLC